MGEFTVIPSSQPRCTGSPDDPSIPLSQTNPTPYCPTLPTGPSGCFIQSNGLFCAPLSTTRGFLYSAPSLQSNHTDMTTLVPSLSFPTPPLTSNSSANGSIPLPGFAHLGEACSPIDLPTDSALRDLVTRAALSVLDILAHRSTLGLGLGADAANWFVYRGDCAQGTYCDLANQGQGQGGSSGNSARVCKEQLPNYHNCTSYMQCLSLRCDTLEAERSAAAVMDRLPLLSLNVVMSKRVVGGRTLCLPRSYPRTGRDGNSTLGGGGDTPVATAAAGFRPWMGGLLAALVVFGGLFVFLLVRRRNRRETQRRELVKEMERQAAAREGRILTRGASKKAGMPGQRTSRSSDKHERHASLGEADHSTPQPLRYYQGAATTLTAIDNNNNNNDNSSSLAHLMGPSTPLSTIDPPYSPSQTHADTVHRIPTLMVATSLSPNDDVPLVGDDVSFNGDEALLMPQRPSGSLRTSSSLTTSSASSSSPRGNSTGTTRISSAPVSPISPLSPASPGPPARFEEGFYDVSAPSPPTARRSQRASHIQGLSPSTRKAP